MTPSCLWFTYTCCVYVSFGFYVISQEIIIKKSVENFEEAEITLESQKRHKIVQTYLNSLPKVVWIDPHEMINFPEEERKTVIPKPASPSAHENNDKLSATDIERDIFLENPEQVTKSPKQFSMLDSVYITRWLKKLLHKIENESKEEANAVTFLLDSKILKWLKELSTAKSLEISEIDKLIDQLISHGAITRKEELKSDILDFSGFFLGNIVYVLCFTAALYILYQFYLQRPILTIAGILLVLNVFWHWMHLYQQKKALKHAELSIAMPEQCSRQEFGLYQYFTEYLKSFFTSNECGKYYEALLVDPFWEVSITVAISEAITAVFFQPLSASSKAINIALKQLFDGLSFFMVIFLVIFMFLILVMMFNYKIRFPWFIAVLEPQPAIVGCQVENIPVKRLKNTIHEAIFGVLSSDIQTLPKISNGNDRDVKIIYDSNSSQKGASSVQDTEIKTKENMRRETKEQQIIKENNADIKGMFADSNLLQNSISIVEDIDIQTSQQISKENVCTREVLNKDTNSLQKAAVASIKDTEIQSLSQLSKEDKDLKPVEDSKFGVTKNNKSVHFFYGEDYEYKRIEDIKSSCKTFSPTSYGPEHESDSDCSSDDDRHSMHVNCKICESTPYKVVNSVIR